MKEENTLSPGLRGGRKVKKYRPLPYEKGTGQDHSFCTLAQGNQTKRKKGNREDFLANFKRIKVCIAGQ